MSVNVKTLQDQIFTWIRIRKNCSVSQLVMACKRLVEPYKDNLPYASNAIYWLIFPLLRVGILEYAIEETGVIVFGSKKMKFTLPNGTIIQANDEKNLAWFHITDDLFVFSLFVVLLISFLFDSESIISLYISIPVTSSINL